jgi:micrococcal nuclease
MSTPRPANSQGRRAGRRSIPRQWIVAAAIVLVAVLAGVDRLGLRKRHTEPQDDWARYDGKVFAVPYVVDGDTIDLDVPDPVQKRPRTRVRLWGVDTPEKARAGQPGMYYADQATAFTTDQVLGKSVRVQLHPGKGTRDKYRRLLAYIALPDAQETLNERLVETGSAYADRRFAHMHMDRFLQLEDQARREGRGLWQAVTPQQWPPWRQRMVPAQR